jgi:GNAT superfamily N-acetyltransferase
MRQPVVVMISGPSGGLLEVRRHSYDDLVVQLLVREMAEDLASLYGPGQYPPQDPARWAPPEGTMLVAWSGGVPVGCGGLVRHDAATAEVKRMFVRTQYRRLGVARLLLRRLGEEACWLGYEGLILETGTLQPAAQALYLEEGFQPTPCWPPHDGDPTSLCFSRGVRT